MRDFFEGFVIHEPLIKHQHGCLNIYVVSRWVRALFKKTQCHIKKIKSPLDFL